MNRFKINGPVTGKRWQRAELLLFTLVTIITMVPFISTKFFPSLDGASHLSNSNIISQILFHNNDLFRQFFRLNPEPVPNWTSHLFLSAAKQIMPAFLAEKLMIIILLAGVPFAFRSLMHRLAPRTILYSYLIFPFNHSMFLFFGFFNFCFAILFFLTGLNYWLKKENAPPGIRKTAVLTLLVALTYFSHIAVFGALLITIAMRILTKTVLAFFCSQNDRKTIRKEFFRHTLTIALPALIPLILFVYFFLSRPGTRQINFIAREELFKFLYTVRPLISFNPEIESSHTVILFWMFLSLLAAGLIGFLIRAHLHMYLNKNHPGTAPEGRVLPSVNFWWLFSSSIVFLFLYFSLPDAYGTASYTNLRMGFIFFLLLILLISTFRIHKLIAVIAVLISFYANTLLIRYYIPTIRDLGKMASACNKAAEFVSPNSLVLPVYCMDNWFTGHFVDYIATDKAVLPVYNYECVTGYFPVIWNNDKKPNFYLGNPSDPSAYIHFEETKGRPSLKLGYVFIVGDFDPGKDWFFTTLNNALSRYFTCVYRSEYCRLYENNQR